MNGQHDLQGIRGALLEKENQYLDHKLLRGEIIVVEEYLVAARFAYAATLFGCDVALGVLWGWC
jgi:hypothetical protein